MISKKQLKQDLKQEFEKILPDVYSKVVARRVLPSPLGFEINIKKRLSISFSKLALATALLLGVLSYGGYSYYNPNTILSINVSPTLLNTILRLGGYAPTIEENEANVSITLAVNDYERVVELDADHQEYHNALNAMGLINQNYQLALRRLFIHLMQNGDYDLRANAGAVTIMILDSNPRRIEKFNNYINQRLSNDLGVVNKQLIKTEKVEFETSPGMAPSIHPAKAMAIKEIMLRTNKYTFEQLSAMDKMELLRVMMELKRNNR